MRAMAIHDCANLLLGGVAYHLMHEGVFRSWTSCVAFSRIDCTFGGYAAWPLSVWQPQSDMDDTGLARHAAG